MNEKLGTFPGLHKIPQLPLQFEEALVKGSSLQLSLILTRKPLQISAAAVTLAERRCTRRRESRMSTRATLLQCTLVYCAVLLAGGGNTLGLLPLLYASR